MHFEGLQRLLGAIDSVPRGRAELLRRAQIGDEDEWRELIDELLSRKLVEQIGNRRAACYVRTTRSLDETGNVRHATSARPRYSPSEVVSGTDRSRLLAAIDGTPRSRSDLMSRSGISLVAWGRAIDALVAQGVVHRQGNRATATYIRVSPSGLYDGAEGGGNVSIGPSPVCDSVQDDIDSILKELLGTEHVPIATVGGTSSDTADNIGGQRSLAYRTVGVSAALGKGQADDSGIPPTVMRYEQADLFGPQRHGSSSTVRSESMAESESSHAVVRGTATTGGRAESTVPSRDKGPLLSNRRAPTPSASTEARPRSFDSADQFGSARPRPQVEVIDRRSVGGLYWIVDSQSAREYIVAWKTAGVGFHFAAGGGRATGGRPAWWSRDKRLKAP